MKFSTKKLSQIVTQLCLAKGIKSIVISPGSRNAPLTLGFTENNNFTNYSIVDERSAAFFALGIAQQTKVPVALVCTSGSALLNYYPAIAEAFYSDIPLVILSADRPSKLIDIGDGQTINQENVFQNHILESVNCIEGSEFDDYNQILINSALNSAIINKGPVHINLPFSEPLYDTVDELSVIIKNEIKTESISSINEDLEPFILKWNKAKRKIILVGVLAPNDLENQVIELMTKDESVIVLTETTSNLSHSNFISSIDQLIASFSEEEIYNFKPEILLTFGGMIVSKKIKALLRGYQIKEHWHIDKKKAYDTYFSLTHHFKTKPNKFLKEFLKKTTPIKSNFQFNWLNKKAYRLRKHKEYLNSIDFSDFKVFSSVFKHIPKNIHLQLSNSATIRYAQLFNFDSSIEMYCNRGTSGIDGSTSTAIGAAVATKKETVFITGDLSFLYDSNAFWNNYIPSNFKVIVINNKGGGIFRILPGNKNTSNFNLFFETKHSLTAEHLCKMYGFTYSCVNVEKHLEDEIITFFKPATRPMLLEIFTPTELNDRVLLDYFEFIK